MLVLIFRSQGTWKCVGVESGTKFDVDLSEGEWVDYDEKVPVYHPLASFEVG